MNECGVSYLIHGPSKAGKTTLTATAPGPLLLLDAEGNSRFLKTRKIDWNPIEPPPKHNNDWDTCIVMIRDYNNLSYVYQWLVTGHHPFRSIGLDSISEIQQRCVDSIAGDSAMKLQQWGELSRKVSTLVRQYRDLLVHPTNPVDAVVFTAMTKQDQEGRWYPFVQGQLATSLPYYVDVIGYLKAQIGDDGAFSNFLLTKPHLQYEAGDRTGIYPQVINNPRIDNMVTDFCKSMKESETTK